MLIWALAANPHFSVICQRGMGDIRDTMSCRVLCPFMQVAGQVRYGGAMLRCHWHAMLRTQGNKAYESNFPTAAAKSLKFAFAQSYIIRARPQEGLGCKTKCGAHHAEGDKGRYDGLLQAIVQVPFSALLVGQARQCQHSILDVGLQ